MQSSVGAPPPYDPHGEVPAGSTIFGVPGDSDEPRPVPRAPRPPRVGSSPPFGPPAIELDGFSAAPHGELDLSDLDALSPASEPVGQPHGELDLGELGELGVAPVARAPIPPPPPNPATRVELRPPALPDAGREPADAPMTLDIASALEQPSVDELDLPAPIERDLPGRSRSPAQSKLTPPKMGAAARAGVPAAPSFGIQPSTTAASLDLDLDLPAPADVDLPLPADADLPIPARADLPTPSAMEVRPAALEVAPTGLEVDAAELAVEPATTDLRPSSRADLPAPAKSKRKSDGREPAVASDPRRSPAPKPPTGPVSRKLLYVGAGVLAIAAAGAAVVYSGVLDPDDFEPSTVRGGPGKPSGDAPSVPGAERTQSFMAALARDTPTGYAEAIEEGQRAGDPIAEAEASLLLHLRYGPDPVSSGKGSALLGPFAGQQEPHVRRVLGLEALARNQLGEAETLLVGDEPRTRLYRGWLRMKQGRPADALSEAEAVLVAHADDVAAVALRLEAQVARDPKVALASIEESVTRHADHPALRELAVQAALRSGLLAKAREHAEALVESIDQDASESMSKGYRARAHALQAMALAKGGHMAPALAAHARAVELMPSDVAIALGRIETMVEARELTQAWAEIRAFVQAHPESVEAALLEAEVSIASGKSEEAFSILAKLDAKLPNDARVAHLLGEAHAMNLSVEVAQSAYAAARARDPSHWRAAVGEARMLANARRAADGVTVLDAMLASLGSGPYEDFDTAHAVASLLLAKARLLEEDDRSAAQLALDQALEAEPHHNDAQLARGLLRLRSGQVQLARTDLLEVFQRTGGYPGLVGPLGRVLAAERDLETLEALVGGTLDDAEVTVEHKLVGARLRLLQGRLDEARALLEQVLTRETNNWEAHLVLAETLLEAGDPVTALVEIERVRPPEPTARLHLLRGQILEYNNRHDEARPEYLAALELDPDLHEARMWHGRLLALRGANKQAIEELRVVTDATGDAFPRAWLELGRAQRGLSDHTTALASLRRASSLDPTLYEAFYLEGRLHADQNRHAQAIAAISSAVVDAAADEWWYANALMDLGRAQAKAGQSTQARATFERFLGIAPPNHASRAEAKRQVESLK